MKRREFIGMAAAGAAGLVLPVTTRGGESAASALAHPQLLEILRDERVVRELGQRYRESVPAEGNTRALTDAIACDATATSAAVRRRVSEHVQRDFSEGRTVTLNGWVLSVTEARQCALFSLLPA